MRRRRLLDLRMLGLVVAVLGLTTSVLHAGLGPLLSHSDAAAVWGSQSGQCTSGPSTKPCTISAACQGAMGQGCVGADCSAACSGGASDTTCTSGTAFSSCTNVLVSGGCGTYRVGSACAIKPDNSGCDCFGGIPGIPCSVYQIQVSACTGS